MSAPARLYSIADQAVALPVVTKVVGSEPIGPCEVSAADGLAGDAFVCTRVSGDGAVTRTPCCASCLSTAVQDALDAQLAVWVEVPVVVTS